MMLKNAEIRRLHADFELSGEGAAGGAARYPTSARAAAAADAAAST